MNVWRTGTFMCDSWGSSSEGIGILTKDVIETTTVHTSLLCSRTLWTLHSPVERSWTTPSCSGHMTSILAQISQLRSRGIGFRGEMTMWKNRDKGPSGPPPSPHRVPNFTPVVPLLRVSTHYLPSHSRAMSCIPL